MSQQNILELRQLIYNEKTGCPHQGKWGQVRSVFAVFDFNCAHYWLYRWKSICWVWDCECHSGPIKTDKVHLGWYLTPLFHFNVQKTLPWPLVVIIRAQFFIACIFIASHLYANQKLMMSWGFFNIKSTIVTKIKNRKWKINTKIVSYSMCCIDVRFFSEFISFISYLLLVPISPH